MGYESFGFYVEHSHALVFLKVHVRNMMLVLNLRTKLNSDISRTHLLKLIVSDTTDSLHFQGSYNDVKKGFGRDLTDIL